jgi:hypothetical protein
MVLLWGKRVLKVEGWEWGKSVSLGDMARSVINHVSEIEINGDIVNQKWQCDLERKTNATFTGNIMERMAIDQESHHPTNTLLTLLRYGVTIPWCCMAIFGIPKLPMIAPWLRTESVLGHWFQVNEDDISDVGILYWFLVIMHTFWIRVSVRTVRFGAGSDTQNYLLFTHRSIGVVDSVIMSLSLPGSCGAIRIPAFKSIPVVGPYVGPSFSGPDNPRVLRRFTRSHGE